jgi:hypothetical protein
MVFALERHTESNILRQDAEESCPFSARPPQAMELVTGPCARLENQTKETVAVSESTQAPLSTPKEIPGNRKHERREPN